MDENNKRSMHKIADALHHAVSTTNRFWYVVAALLSVQTILAVSDGNFTKTAINPTALALFTILTVLLACNLQLGGTALLLVWTLLQLVPNFNGVPYIITICSATAILFANCTMRYAIATLLSTLLIFAAEFFAFQSNPSTTKEQVASSMLLIMLALTISTIIGLEVRQAYTTAKVEQDKAELALNAAHIEQLQRDTKLASTLHDDLTNNLSYVMTLAYTNRDSSPAAEQREAWQNVIDETSKAFDTAHKIIDVLHSTRRTATQQTSEHLLQTVMAQLQNTVEHCDAKLHALNFDGQATISTTVQNPASTAISPDVADEVIHLTEEVYANIRRHGAEHSSYSYAAAFNENTVTIVEMNTADSRHKRAVIGKSGRGIALHRQTIEALGGTLNASQDAQTWVVRVSIPIHG